MRDCEKAYNEAHQAQFNGGSLDVKYAYAQKYVDCLYELSSGQLQEIQILHILLTLIQIIPIPQQQPHNNNLNPFHLSHQSILWPYIVCSQIYSPFTDLLQISSLLSAYNPMLMQQQPEANYGMMVTTFIPLTFSNPK